VKKAEVGKGLTNGEGSKDNPGGSSEEMEQLRK
jgi:hypothetical protein